MVVDELTVALAVFCKLHDVPFRSASKELDVTPRAHFDEAAVWAESNAKVIQLLKSDPEAVANGSYTLNEGRGWFSRLLGIGKKKGPTALTDDELEVMAREVGSAPKTLDKERAKRLAALRELVDESFEAS